MENKKRKRYNLYYIFLEDKEKKKLTFRMKVKRIRSCFEKYEKQ